MSDPIAETTTAPTVTEPSSNHFRVNWEIDIENDTDEAISALSAALKAWTQNFQDTFGAPTPDNPCTFTLTPISENGVSGQPLVIDLSDHC